MDPVATASPPGVPLPIRPRDAIDAEGARDPFPIAVAAEVAARVTAAGAAIGLFAGSLALGDAYPVFVDANTLEAGPRTAVVAAVLVGAILPLGLVLGLLLVFRARALPRLRVFGRLVSPLALLAAMPALLAYGHWRYDPLTYLVLLGGVTILAERFMRDALACVPPSFTDYVAERAAALPPRVRRHGPTAIVVLLGAAYGAWAVHFTWMNHRRLGTSGFDLGIYDNILYNALHGHPFRSPVLYGPDGGNYVANHAEFAMLLFLPIYAIHPGPESLLVLQGVLFGMAAVPLYLFARTQIPRGSAVVVAAAYLMFAPLHGPNFYDFHWLPCAVFFHFWLYYGIATRRPWLVAAMLVILFAIREDVAVGTAMLGLFLTVTGARPKLGLIVAAASVAWFVADKFGIMMYAGTWWFSDLYHDLIPTGEAGYGAVIRTLLTNPAYVLSTLLKADKLTYALHLYAPLAFLPARRPAFLLLGFPGFFFTLLTTAYAPTISIAFQYTTHWIPYLFAAAVLALMLLSRAEDGGTRRRAALFAMGLGVLCHSYVFGAILQRETFVGGFTRIAFAMSEADEAVERDLGAIVRAIPPTAEVAATDAECPHVSTRPTAYSLDHFHGDAEYLLIDSERIGLGKENIADAFARNTYGLVEHIGRFYLFRRDQTNPQTDDAMRSLGIQSASKEGSR